MHARMLNTALLVSLTACAIHPVSGRPRVMVMSERQEEKLGLAASREIEARYGVVTGDIADYLQRLGARVASVASGPSFRYRFALLDTDEVLAMALPGGFIYVSRGLLLLMSSEDQLAGVIAHEVAHVAVQHVAERAVVAVPLDVLGAVVGAVVRLVSADAGARLRDAVVEMGVAPYSRAQEREADRVGAALAASLGYDALALSVALERIAGARELSAGSSREDAHHPATVERVALLQTYAQGLERGEASPLRASDSAFLEELNGLLIGPSLAQARLRDHAVVWPSAKLTAPLPAQWSSEVTLTGVVAVSPEGYGFLTLTRLVDADDKALFEESRFVPRPPLVTTSGWEVSRGSLRAGEEGASDEHLWWLSRDNDVYVWTGTWSARDDAVLSPMVDASVAAARLASDDDLAGISVLKVVHAQDNESFAQLWTRVGSDGAVTYGALMNGVAVDELLGGGRALKVMGP